jgi:diguanylate cyclase (GGDEF)-like protein/PAS domain S-box-containing protein
MCYDENGKKIHIRKEGLKICVIYFVIGFIWIYFSDRIVANIIYDVQTKLLMNTYKGMLYVFVTSLLLYYLISNLLQKVERAEKRLTQSYSELSAANVELQTYINQLTTSKGELKKKHNQIAEVHYQLNASEEKYKALISKMQLGVALYEGNSQDVYHYKLIHINHSYEVLTGLKKEDIVGKSFLEVNQKTGLKDLENLVQAIRTGQPTQYEVIQNQTDYSYEIFAFRFKENQLAVIVNDITKRKQAEERLHFLSYHDQLTGRYNRRYLEEIINQMDNPKNYPLMITMADINGLKLINDSFGHRKGDVCIREVSKVIKKGFREKDIICRMGGDEFIIVSPNTDEKEIRAIINRTKQIAGQKTVNQVPLSVSFGYCAKYKEEERLQEIYKKAEDYMYKRKLLESPSMRGKTIYTIIAALHEKNPREEEHSHRVSLLCEKMGIALGLPQDEIKELKTVGLLHDIGKVAIPDEILNKEGKLKEEEWEQIKRHPEIGYRILSTVNDLSEMAEYVLAHHERFDGLGYPKGLKGDEIPMQSMIISIADTYDAMVSERSYRKAMSKQYAIRELKKNAGSQFSEKFVKIFIEKVIDAEEI